MNRYADGKNAAKYASDFGSYLRDLYEYATTPSVPQIMNEEAVASAPIPDAESYIPTKPIYDNGDAKDKVDIDTDRIEKIPARNSWAYSLPGVMTGIGQYITAKTSKPKSVDIYAPNRYLPGALQRLSQMRINAQPLIDEAIRQSRMARYNALQSGGLTAGQRWLDNVVRDAQTADALAKIRRDVQMQNNAYNTAYAQAAIAAGQEEAKQRQMANQYNEEYFARAHAARQAGMNAGLYNMAANIQQMGKNEFRRRMFNSNLDVWQQEVRNKQSK